MTATSSENYQQYTYEQYTSWVIRLRWYVILVSLILLVVTGPIYGYIPHGNILYLFSLFVFLFLLNCFFAWKKHTFFSEKKLATQLVIDLVILTTALHLSGGLENPLYVSFIFHGIISSIIFRPKIALLLSTICISLFLSLAVLEGFKLVPHYTVSFTPHGHDSPGSHPSHDLVFILSRTMSFVIAYLATSYFTGFLVHRIRKREREYAVLFAEAQKERERLQIVLHATGVHMTLYSADLEMIWSNVEDDSLGTQDGAIIGTYTELCAEEDLRLVYETGQMLERERIRADNGSFQNIRLTIRPVKGPDSNVQQLSVISQDITSLKSLQSRANHSGRMKSLGKLVSIVAHEVGNPLASIRTRIQRLKKNVSPDFIDQSLVLIEEQLVRISHILQGLSDYGANRPGKWEECDMNALLRQLLDLMQDELGTRIQVELSLKSDLPTTYCVRDQLYQVFWNILRNSCKAMDEGTISIKTDYSGGKILIVIQDTGPGIPEETKEKIFDPFFTTRRDGMGLGLSVSKTYIQAHNGEIIIQNSKDRGAEAIVSIPIILAAMNTRDEITANR